MKIFDQDEKNIREAFSLIKVNADGLAEKVKGRLHEEGHNDLSGGLATDLSGNLNVGLPKGKRYRPLLIAAALCAVFAITAVAAELGSFQWFVQRFNPAFGEIVEPVEIYAEDQGIRMELIGAQKYDNQAVVYLSLQDVSGQNRLTDKTDFRDGFSVKTVLPQSDAAGEENGQDELVSSIGWSKELLYFDEEANTAYYEFNITADANSPLYDPLTLEGFLLYFDLIHYEEEPVLMNLSDLREAEIVPVTEENIFGIGGDYLYNEIYSVLKPGYFAEMPHGQNDQWISNMSYMDGKLYVQIATEWNKEFGSSDMQFLLVRPDGSLIESDFSVTLLGNEEHELLSLEEDDVYDRAKYKYTETIFTIAEEELADYTLCFNGFSSTGVEGRWEVTASLGDISKQIRSWKNEVSIGDHLLEYFNLNPLGLQVIGSYKGSEHMSGDMEVFVETVDGMVSLESSGGSYSTSAKTFCYNWNASTPLEIEKAVAIVVDGVRIPVE